MKNTSIYLLAFLAILFLSPLSLSAQVISLDEAPEDEISAPFDKSFMLMAFPLSSYLYHTGYENMGNHLKSFGGLENPRFFENIGFGVGWRKKNLFYNINASLPLFTQRDEVSLVSMTRIMESRDSNFDLSVGYAIIPSDQFYWILRAGIGLYFREMSVKEISNVPYDFRDFSTPEGTAWPQLDHRNLTLDVAFEMLPKAMREVAMLQSFQLGYKHGIGSPRWRSAEANLVNPIRDRVSLFYLRGLIVISRER
ncbi:hypothetical protein [Litoribacter populi]|uniref:hypothetical protein n=1 Tax=Litoribacter populi TaxID=2598460 RepID=UPI001180CE77|nr:hypothetical protein [Litoribacter populi]